MKSLLFLSLLVLIPVSDKTKRFVYEKEAQYEVHILLEDPEIKPKEGVDYYQYKNQSIKITRGHYSSHLLHGSYKKSDRKLNLLEMGTFDKGRKEGYWFYYNSSGKLLKKERYKNGRLQGDYKEFENNEIVLIGKYSRNEKSGKWIDFHRKDTINYSKNKKSIWNLWGLFKSKDSITVVDNPDTVLVDSLSVKIDSTTLNNIQKKPTTQKKTEEYETIIINGKKRRVRRVKKW
jgi:antitoxin component YwqK of YwqJK toxin-antitoxin module